MFYWCLNITKKVNYFYSTIHKVFVSDFSHNIGYWKRTLGVVGIWEGDNRVSCGSAAVRAVPDRLYLMTTAWTEVCGVPLSHDSANGRHSSVQTGFILWQRQRPTQQRADRLYPMTTAGTEVCGGALFHDSANGRLRSVQTGIILWQRQRQAQPRADRLYLMTAPTAGIAACGQALSLDSANGRAQTGSIICMFMEHVGQFFFSSEF